MILALDVDYRDELASVGGVSFSGWKDSVVGGIYRSELEVAQSYVPGRFYLRELPCLLRLLEEHRLKPEVVVVDGFVFLDGRKEPGLGKYLHDALAGRVAVVGVAKKSFRNISEDFAIYRGNSQKPLYVTSVGMAHREAKRAVREMHGQYRIPTLLKKADQVCRFKPS